MQNTTVVEKLVSAPPALVFLTSVMGYDWRPIFYIVSTIWVLIQIYFRLRKEYGKWQAKKARRPHRDPDDTDKAPL